MIVPFSRWPRSMKSRSLSHLRVALFPIALAFLGGCMNASSKDFGTSRSLSGPKTSMTWLSDCSDRAKRLFSLEIDGANDYLYRGSEFTKVQREERFSARQSRSIPFPVSSAPETSRYCIVVERADAGLPAMTVGSESKQGKRIIAWARELTALEDFVCPQRMAFGGVGSRALKHYCTRLPLFVATVRKAGSCDREIYVHDDGTVHELIDMRVGNSGVADGPIYEDRYFEATPASIAEILKTVRSMSSTARDACEHCGPIETRADPAEVSNVVAMIELAASVRFGDADASMLSRCKSTGGASLISLVSED